MFRKRISAELHDRIVQDYNSGLTMQSIAYKYGISVYCVYYHVNLKRCRCMEQKMNLRMDRYKAGMTNREIAEAEGCEPGTICSWLRKHNLQSNRVKRE